MRLNGAPIRLNGVLGPPEIDAMIANTENRGALLSSVSDVAVNGVSSTISPWAAAPFPA